MRESLLLAGALLAAASAAASFQDAPVIVTEGGMSYIKVGDAVIKANPGSVTTVTRIDEQGIVTSENVSIPETQEMTKAKQRYLEDAAATYTLSVTSVEDRNGEVIAPDVVFVMKDKYMFWKLEKSAENEFTLPEGL